MMNSKVAHKIKHRDKPKDVFITPEKLAKKNIDMIDESYRNLVWYDPFKNSGSYYNQFPSDNKKWSEILENKDFIQVALVGLIKVVQYIAPTSSFDSLVKI